MTKGISPKAIAAFFYPFVTTVVVVGIRWLSIGTFDRAQIITGLSGLSASGLALLGAYIHSPGNTAPNVGMPSDGLMSDYDQTHSASGIAPREETIHPPV